MQHDATWTEIWSLAVTHLLTTHSHNDSPMLTKSATMAELKAGAPEPTTNDNGDNDDDDDEQEDGEDLKTTTLPLPTEVEVPPAPPTSNSVASSHGSHSCLLTC